MRKRIIAMMLILIFVFTCFQGCTKKEQENEKMNGKQTIAGQTDKKTTELGRYMEKEVEFPKLKENEAVTKIIHNADSQIELYTKVKGEYQCYRLKEDMTWEKGQAGWLNDSNLGSKSVELNDLCCGEDGNYYVVYTDYSGNSTVHHILKSENKGKTSREIEIPYLKKKQSFGDNEMYPVIQKIQVLKNGNLVLNDYLKDDKLLLFSPKGEKIDQLSAAVSEDTGKVSYTVSGNDIITAAKDKKSIILYNSEGKKEKSMEYDVNQHSMAFARDTDGTLFCGNRDGIHRLNAGSTLWETTVDGTLNSMSMPSLIFDELFVVKGETEQYYASYQNTNGNCKLLHYVFDKSVSSVPAHEITVYSLQENNTIRQAISLFQAKNTDIKVNYVVAIGEEGGIVSDYIRALNTELLGRRGADVLVLDGLPIDSYLEKGVLSDLSDVIKPLKDSGELLPNISGCYNTEGKIYQMPIRFSFPMMIGKQGALSSIKDMNSVVNYIKQLNGNAYIGSSAYRKLLQDHLALYSKDLFENGELSKEKLTEFIQNVKVVSDNCKATEQDKYEEASKGTDTGFIDKASLFSNQILGLKKNKYECSIQRVRDVFSTAIPFALVNQCNLKIASINQMFIPNGLIGLNQASKETKIAKQFIRFLYTKELQDSNLYDGFPINVKSLTGWINKEDKNSMFGMSDRDGNEVTATWPTKKEREDLFTIIKELKTPIEINQSINGIIIDEALSYLTGDVEADEAANKAYSKINTYLAE